jgi:hypothetical protein
VTEVRPRKRITNALATSAWIGALSCGGTVASVDSHAISDDVDSGSKATADAGASHASTDSSAPDAATQYSGLVSATARSYRGGFTHTIDASFWDHTGPRQQSCGTVNVKIGDCCAGVLGTVLPIGPPTPLTAGDIAIGIEGNLLATLLAPDYAEVTDAKWPDGSPLDVSAGGGNVSSFDGRLITPFEIAGVTPAFGSTPVVIPAGADFRVSWTPETNYVAQMSLQIDLLAGGAANFVLCTVPDSAKSVVVDAKLLAAVPAATDGSIHLTRSITSYATGANVSVTLVGEASLNALATLK